MKEGAALTAEVWFRRDWIIPSELGREKNVRNELLRTFQELQLQEARIDEIMTAVSEAMLNAIEHGNRLAKDLPVKITMFIHPDRYTFWITDQGIGMDIDAATDVAQVRHRMDWEDPRGWGLQLMYHYADEVYALRHNGEFSIALDFLKIEAEEGNTI